MSLTTAASGFVVFFLSLQVIQGQDDWGVTYTSTEICALKGSTVYLHCSYRYPSRIKGRDTTVEERFWFSKMNWYQPVDLTTDSEYSGRVLYSCDEESCTLRITDLRESDSAEYKFRFITNQQGGRFTGSPGVTLSVTDPGLQVKVMKSTAYRSYTWAELKCHSSCRLPDRTSYIWYKNGQNIWAKTSSCSGSFYPADSYFCASYKGRFSLGDNISCALKGHEDSPSPSVYAPKLPSVSVSPSGEIVEGSSVTLTCSSDANPAANFTWYKKTVNVKPLGKEPEPVFSSIQSSESGEYYCTAESELGRRTSEHITIDVKYAPKPPSVSVSPSGEIVEGSSVNLTCSSDANPAANYTWYKENQTLTQGPEDTYFFNSISSGDSGTYHCKSENKYGQLNSTSVHIDVQYAPKLPSVSVSPSAETVEGSSVTLTCSSDANPAANYTWYKENEDSPKASGQIFTITDIKSEHSGNYYCEAQNRRGRQNSTLHLIVVAGSMKSVAAGSITAIFLAIIFLCAVLLIRRKRSSKQTTEPGERPDNTAQLNIGSVCNSHSAAVQRNPAEEQDDLCYANVSFSKNQEDPLYSNIRPAQGNRQKNEEEEDEDEEGVEYTMVIFKSASASSELRHQEAVEDSSALYSTVTKKPRV